MKLEKLFTTEHGKTKNCYLAAPRPTLGHYRGDSLTHPMLITYVLHIRPEGHREPRSEVGSLSPTKWGLHQETSDSDQNALTH